MCAGGLPGPVLFGFAIDHSCLLWEKKCDGSTGACLYYDNHHMAWLLLAVCAVCKVLNIASGFLSWRMCLYKQQKDNAPGPQTAVEYMLSLDRTTGNGQTGSSYGSTESIVSEDLRDQAAMSASRPNPSTETGDNDL